MPVPDRVEAEDTGPVADLGRVHAGLGGNYIPLETPGNEDRIVAAADSAKYLGEVALVDGLGAERKRNYLRLFCKESG